MLLVTQKFERQVPRTGWQWRGKSCSWGHCWPGRHVPQLRTLLSWQTHLPANQGTTPAALQWTAALAARGTVNNPFELLPPVPKCDQYIMTPMAWCEPSPAFSGWVWTTVTRKRRDIRDIQRALCSTQISWQKCSHPIRSQDRVAHRSRIRDILPSSPCPCLMWQVTSSPASLVPSHSWMWNSALRSLTPGILPLGFCPCLGQTAWGKMCLQDNHDAGLRTSAPRVPQQDTAHVVVKLTAPSPVTGSF